MPRLDAAPPTVHARYTTPAVMPTMTIVVATAYRCDSQASVPLERPTKASPTTGITGAPQPMTVQPPVARPHTLPAAPRAPPRRRGEPPPPAEPAWSRR